MDGSDYKIESKLSNQKEINQMKETDNRYKNDLNKLNEELNILSSIMDYIDDAIANNVEVGVVKQTIKSQNVDLYNEMNLDSITNLGEIKNTLTAMYKQKEEEKEKKIKEKKGIVDEIVRQNALGAKEIDEKKKEVLKFLHQIKFDLLPKELTDQILNEFKSNIFSIPGVRYFFQKVQIN